MKILGFIALLILSCIIVFTVSYLLGYRNRARAIVNLYISSHKEDEESEDTE